MKELAAKLQTCISHEPEYIELQNQLVRRVQGDGDCFWYAVQDQLYQRYLEFKSANLWDSQGFALRDLFQDNKIPSIKALKKKVKSQIETQFKIDVWLQKLLPERDQMCKDALNDANTNLANLIVQPCPAKHLYAGYLEAYVLATALRVTICLISPNLGGGKNDTPFRWIFKQQRKFEDATTIRPVLFLFQESRDHWSSLTRFPNMQQTHYSLFKATLLEKQKSFEGNHDSKDLKDEYASIDVGYHTEIIGSQIAGKIRKFSESQGKYDEEFEALEDEDTTAYTQQPRMVVPLMEKYKAAQSLMTMVSDWFTEVTAHIDDDGAIEDADVASKPLCVDNTKNADKYGPMVIAQANPAFSEEANDMDSVTAKIKQVEQAQEDFKGLATDPARQVPFDANPALNMSRLAPLQRYDDIFHNIPKELQKVADALEEKKADAEKAAAEKAVGTGRG